MAERVVRRVHGHPGDRRGDPVRRRRGPRSRMRRKAWGYAADQRPSTHPVAPTERRATPTTALLNFDGISYAKGASVAAPAGRVGRRRGVPRRPARVLRRRTPTATPPWPTCSAALSAASGRDLTDWAEVWLRAGRRSTRCAPRSIGAGRPYARSPSCRPPRPSTRRCARTGSASACYDRDADGHVLRRSGSRSTSTRRRPHRRYRRWPASRPADLLLLNDGDLTFAKVRLDDDDPRRGWPTCCRALARPAGPRRACGPRRWTPSATASGRSPTWSTCWWPRCRRETEMIVVEDVCARRARWSTAYLPPDDAAPAALARVAARLRRRWSPRAAAAARASSRAMRAPGRRRPSTSPAARLARRRRRRRRA